MAETLDPTTTAKIYDSSRYLPPPNITSFPLLCMELAWDAHSTFAVQQFQGALDYSCKHSSTFKQTFYIIIIKNCHSRISWISAPISVLQWPVAIEHKLTADFCKSQQVDLSLMEAARAVSEVHIKLSELLIRCQVATIYRKVRSCMSHWKSGTVEALSMKNILTAYSAEFE